MHRLPKILFRRPRFDTSTGCLLRPGPGEPPESPPSDVGSSPAPVEEHGISSSGPSSSASSVFSSASPLDPSSPHQAGLPPTVAPREDDDDVDSPMRDADDDRGSVPSASPNNIFMPSRRMPLTELCNALRIDPLDLLLDLTNGTRSKTHHAAELRPLIHLRVLSAKLRLFWPRMLQMLAGISVLSQLRDRLRVAVGLLRLQKRVERPEEGSGADACGIGVFPSLVPVAVAAAGESTDGTSPGGGSGPVPPAPPPPGAAASAAAPSPGSVVGATTATTATATARPTSSTPSPQRQRRVSSAGGAGGVSLLTPPGATITTSSSSSPQQPTIQSPPSASASQSTVSPGFARLRSEEAHEGDMLRVIAWLRTVLSERKISLAKLTFQFGRLFGLLEMIARSLSQSANGRILGVVREIVDCPEAACSLRMKYWWAKRLALGLLLEMVGWRLDLILGNALAVSPDSESERCEMHVRGRLDHTRKADVVRRAADRKYRSEQLRRFYLAQSKSKSKSEKSEKSEEDDTTTIRLLDAVSERTDWGEFARAVAEFTSSVLRVGEAPAKKRKRVSVSQKKEEEEVQRLPREVQAVPRTVSFGVSTATTRTRDEGFQTDFGDRDDDDAIVVVVPTSSESEEKADQQAALPSSPRSPALSSPSSPESPLQLSQVRQSPLSQQMALGGLAEDEDFSSLFGEDRDGDATPSPKSESEGSSKDSDSPSKKRRRIVRFDDTAPPPAPASQLEEGEMDEGDDSDDAMQCTQMMDLEFSLPGGLSGDDVVGDESGESGETVDDVMEDVTVEEAKLFTQPPL